MSGLTDPEIAPLLDKGKPFKGKSWSDAEASAASGQDGKVIVGFETHGRAGIYDLGKMVFKAPDRAAAHPARNHEGPHNSELEAIGRFLPALGGFIAISERTSMRRQYPRLDLAARSPFAFSIKRNDRLRHHRSCDPADATI